MALESLIALRTAAPPITVPDAEYLARTLYGLDAKATPLHGERDRNFRLSVNERAYVLKVIDPAMDAGTLECQTLVLAHLAEQAPELPVPRIILTEQHATIGRASVHGAAYRLWMMEFMPGELAGNSARDATLLGVIGQTLGRLDHALRGFFHPALAQPIVWDVRRAPALLEYVDYLPSPATQRHVRAALEPLANQPSALRALRAQAIHGDFHPCNILLSKAGDACTGILDFGDMIHAPVVLDPAVTMAEFLVQGTADLEQIGAILTGFCAVNPLEGDDVEVLYDLIAARIATALVVYEWRRRHDEAGAAATAESFSFAAESLARLAAVGRETLTRNWHRLAGTTGRTAALQATTRVPRPAAPDAALLQRRRGLLGANAELSYDVPLHLVRGDGVWVYAADGQRFLDVYNNVPHVGHAHPAVVDAVRVQASRIASNTRYLDEIILDYAERLTATLPDSLDTCLFVNSGSEANDIAWQIAQSYTGRRGAIVMTHAYHGITEALAALSPEIRRSDAANVECLAAPPGNKAVSMSTSAELAALASRDVERALAALEQRGFGLAAFMFDSAFTSSGVFDPPPAWMAPIVTAIRAAGGMIIGDEVQFGLGRSGSNLWGFARRGYTPDIVTLGKPVGNGYPLGVVMTRRHILEKFQEETRFFSTFGGNPVAAAAGCAVLDIVEREQLMAKAEMTGTYFKERLLELARTQETLGEIRGSGLLLGVEVIGPDALPAPRHARRIVNSLRERGILIGSSGPQGHILKLRPPMVFGHDHVNEVIETLTAVLETAALRGDG
jgi:4-aminobutyrate aminotransferase-like enzyme/Ser/Thr protein kinase RdoA (MazF antagonist)